MVLFLGFLRKLFGGGVGGSTAQAAAGGKVTAGSTGKPITCLKCGATYAVAGFPKTNGVCRKCNADSFSFLTDDVSDEELAKNKELSAGAKFVLDADDEHIENINGRKLIQYLRNKGLVS